MTWQRARGILSFILFILLAAPIEFNLALYFGETERAWVAGVLYFFAFVVSIEAWMRLETHPEIAERPAIWFLKLALLVPIGLFALDFLPRRFGGNLAATSQTPCWDIGMGQWQYQAQAAIFAALLAVVTHAIVDSTNQSMKRLKER